MPPPPPTPAAYWSMTPDEVLSSVRSGTGGLASEEALKRRSRERDPLGEHRRRPWIRLLLAQFTTPIALLLVAATIVSTALGDTIDGAIILMIVVASGVLGFWQEFRADAAVAELLASVQVTARVLRAGQSRMLALGEIVVGDVVELAAGDLVPADCRLLSSAELLVDASALTGESFPVEKDAGVSSGPAEPVASRDGCVQFGSHVVSGTARAVVVATGRNTEFGRVTKSIGGAAVRTAFEHGVGEFGWLLVRIMSVLTLLIFLVNWLMGRPLFESLLFSLALAVGITPQMLPAIVAVSVSAGARRLAARHVVVKRLDAIEDLGAMTILCTDKTGTLTAGAARLDRAIDLDGQESTRVLELAALNAGGERGFRNPLDAAILQRQASSAQAFDELPYDFQRKRLSVLVSYRDQDLLVTKGSVLGVLRVCTHAEIGGALVPLEDIRIAVESRVDALCADGFRVLAVAIRSRRPDAGPLELGDESAMVLVGLLAFYDPPKPGSAEAVAALADLGVGVRLITGDSVATAKATAATVGIDATRVVTGLEIGELDTPRLAVLIRDVQVFAEVEPMHKQRIVAALRRGGAVVGFLGDGINDAPAMHSADVGISVDTAVDVAKQAASVVLLSRGLDVIVDGVRLGRQTFANTLKYIRLTTSANFGNMLSLAIASIVLPFLPLLPRQILLLNFLSDIPAMAIAGDAVDDEQTRRPVIWNVASIQRFMVVFGVLSTLFDVAAFAVLIGVFHAAEPLFQGSWFVMSTLTELAVLFSLRTSRPIWRSRPARGLLISSLAVALVTAATPYVPFLATLLGLAPPPPLLFLVLAGILLAYVAANEALKRLFFGRERQRDAGTGGQAASQSMLPAPRSLR